jgi:hypothetical protein
MSLTEKELLETVAYFTAHFTACTPCHCGGVLDIRVTRSLSCGGNIPPIFSFSCPCGKKLRYDGEQSDAYDAWNLIAEEKAG